MASYVLFLLSLGALSAHRNAAYKGKGDTGVDQAVRGYSKYGEYTMGKYQRDYYGNPAAIPQVGTALVDRSMRFINVAPSAEHVRKMAMLKHSTMASITERPSRLHGVLREGGLMVTPKTDRYGYHSVEHLRRTVNSVYNGAAELVHHRPPATYSSRFENRRK